MGGFQQRYSEEDIFRGSTWENLFKDLGFGGGDIFSMIFGRQAGRGAKQQRRQQAWDFNDYITRQQQGTQTAQDLDLHYELEIPFMDAIHGRKNGSRWPRDGYGRGERQDTERDHEREKLRLKGKGNQGLRGNVVTSI
jgi:curved DNA-binding protein